MAEEKNTPFNYLLNAMEHAGQEAHPAKAGYAGKRKALLAHVRELERDAARYRWLRNFGNFAIVDQMLDSTEFNTLDLAVDSAMGAAGVPVDRGPWSVVQGVDGKPELFSDDFEHDVKLRISGDFADDQQRMNYATALAAQLNATPGVQAGVRALTDEAIDRLARKHGATLDDDNGMVPAFYSIPMNNLAPFVRAAIASGVEGRKP